MVSKYLISTLIFLAGLIKFLPVLAVLSATRVEATYRVSVADPNLEILLRHRAVLFGLLGGFMFLSVFRPHLQGLAISAGLISILSFILLSYIVGDYNTAIAGIIRADYLALAFLLIALILKLLSPQLS